MASALGVRVDAARIGIVLGAGGGAAREMLPPFKMGVGGPIGNGRQAMSWIHCDDLVALLFAAVEDDPVAGVTECDRARPPSRTGELAKAIGKALHRPAFLPTPGFALDRPQGPGRRNPRDGPAGAAPRVAQRLGFAWRYPTIDSALQNLVGR